MFHSLRSILTSISNSQQTLPHIKTCHMEKEQYTGTSLPPPPNYLGNFLPVRQTQNSILAAKVAKQGNFEEKGTRFVCLFAGPTSLSQWRWSLAITCGSVSSILLTKQAELHRPRQRTHSGAANAEKSLIDGPVRNLHLDHFRSSADMHVYSIFRQMSRPHLVRKNNKNWLEFATSGYKFFLHLVFLIFLPLFFTFPMIFFFFFAYCSLSTHQHLSFVAFVIFLLVFSNFPQKQSTYWTTQKCRNWGAYFTNMNRAINGQQTAKSS